MSVPFKYRQYFRDLFSSFGGKPLAAEDIRFIVERLPFPKFSSSIVDSYVGQCPLDEAGLLKMFGEGQKECGTSYDDLAWGLVEGIARHNFFHGDEGAEASVDTKELRAVLDPKIRPVRLDVNAIFSANTSGGERTTIAELMLVLRAIFPANQTNFAELFSWARASRPAARRPRPADGKAESATDPPPQVAARPEKEAVVEEPSAPAAEPPSAAPSGETPPNAAAAASPEHPQPSSAVVGKSGVEAEAEAFSSIRGRFGSVAKMKPPQQFDVSSPKPMEPLPAQPAHSMDGSVSRRTEDDSSLLRHNSSFGSPAPPPPPQDDGSPLHDGVDAPSEDDESSESSVEAADDNPFAMIAKQQPQQPQPAQTIRRRTSPPQPQPNSPPEVVVTPPPHALRKPSPAPQARPSQDEAAQQSVEPAAALPSSLREPPPLPANIRSAVMGMKSAQSQHYAAVDPIPRETLSLRQVQQLPPEVVEFIQQLDRQRTQLQTQLERELNDLSENQQLMRLFSDRLAALQSLQDTPAFKPLEKERAELIHKMEQWIHCTRAGKEATRVELSNLKRSQLADAAAHSVYRDTILYQRDGPSTTVTSNPAGTTAATAALAALNDPTPRLAKFFENLSTKEREIKAQEAAIDKLKQLERRERRLMSDIATSHQRRERDGSSASPAFPLEYSGPGDKQHPLSAQHFGGQPHPHERRQQPPHHALREQHAPHGESERVGGRVFRMDPSILGGTAAKPTASGAPQGTSPAELYFNFTQEKPLPAATLFGVSRENPYLSKNIADRQRTSIESGSNVTRRLEDFLGAHQRK